MTVSLFLSKHSCMTTQAPILIYKIIYSIILEVRRLNFSDQNVALLQWALRKKKYIVKTMRLATHLAITACLSRPIQTPSIFCQAVIAKSIHTLTLPTFILITVTREESILVSITV